MSSKAPGPMRNRFLLNAVHNKAHSDIRRLQELSAFIECTLSREQNRRTSKAKKKLCAESDEYDQAFLVACYAEDMFQIERDFPRIQRYALFVSAMGSLEAGIVSLCRAAKQIYNISEDFNEREPRVVVRGIRFLQDNVGIDTSRDQCYITLAGDLQKIRNCITHSGGNLKDRKDAEDIRKFVVAKRTIGIDQYDSLLLQAGFVNKMTHGMRTLLDRLYESVSKKMQSNDGP